MKKLLYLFLALMLPGLIFVFLKYQGRNKFDVPVYHKDSVAWDPSCADYKEAYASPYLVAFGELGDRFAPAAANVFVFPKSGVNSSAIAGNIELEFENEDMQWISACDMAGDSARCEMWRKCIFMIEQPWHTVLVDKGGAIRGYYDLRLLEEVDRLRVELKILLEKY